MRHTTVISGFPGIGKSFLASNTFLDLDSGDFNWCPGAPSCPKGTYEKYRNPKGTVDYGEAILKAYKGKKFKYIFVSTHEDTRNFLKRNKIPFILVYPSKSRKFEFKRNYINRKSPDGFVKFIIGNWDNLISGLEKDTNADKKIKMRKGTYLEHHMDKMYIKLNRTVKKRKKMQIKRVKETRFNKSKENMSP